MNVCIVLDREQRFEKVEKRDTKLMKVLLYLQGYSMIYIFWTDQFECRALRVESESYLLRIRKAHEVELLGNLPLSYK